MCLFDIDITCGKGTYIRTLATDIGKALGFPAHMSRLTRTSSGGFNISDSLTIEQIKVLHEQEQLQEKLFPIEYGLKVYLLLKYIMRTSSIVYLMDKSFRSLCFLQLFNNKLYLLMVGHNKF